MNNQENSNRISLKDQIIIIKKLEFEELIDAIRRERPNYIQEFGNRLDKITKVANNWYEAKISNVVINNVILPYHPRCQLSFFPRMLTHIHNQGELVPKYGMTVEETYHRLKQFEKQYNQRRSKCLQLIKKSNGKDLGHIILSQIPIHSIQRHKKIRWNSTSLIHLDGFHRLLSLYYPKKIKFDYVNCFLASIDENLSN